MNVTLLRRRRADTLVGGSDLGGVRGRLRFRRALAGGSCVLIVLATLAAIGGSPAQEQAGYDDEPTVIVNVQPAPQAFTPMAPAIEARRPFYHQEWFWGIVSTTVVGVVTVIWAKKRRRAKYEEA
jgi:hypothetical protein